MAYVVGVLLVLLVFVAMPLKYLAHSEAMISIVGPTHGFLFMVYLVTVIQLAAVFRFGIGRTVLIMAAGVVPFLSFVMERRVTHDVRGRLAEAQARAAA
jgi:integral membrane protein